MKKTPNNIKKTLQQIREELLNDKKLNQSKELYTQKLKEIFTDKVIELEEGLEVKMSSTGSGKSFLTSTVNTATINEQKPSANKSTSEKIIFLNNEIVKKELKTEIEEANEELFNHSSENIIDLKDEVKDDENIIDLKNEVKSVENIIDLTDEVLTKKQNTQKETKLTDKKIDTDQANTESIKRENINEINSFPNDQLGVMNDKINDLDLHSSELSDKIDELLDQKNLFSEKFNDELDIKLTEALNRTEDNLESKLNNINNVYHEEFGKYEDEANKNFAHLENQIGTLNEQYTKIENNIDQINNNIQNNSIEDLETRLDNKINEVINENIKIEDTLKNIDQKINETFESIKINAENKAQEISEKIKSIEPELIQKIEERQKNKTESEKLQEKFDQMSKIMDTQNMRMLQMYHSTELQNSHSILQKNLNQKTSNNINNSNIDPKVLSEEIKKDFFPQIKKEMDQQFNLLKEQLSEYEIKSVLDKINSTDLNKEFKRPIKKFSTLFEAKKYVRNSIAKKSRDWLKNNELAMDEIAKKLLDE